MTSSNGFTNWKVVAETLRIDLEYQIDNDELDTKDAVWYFVKKFGEVNSGGPMTDEICWALDHMYGKTTIHTSGSHVNYLLDKLEEEKKMVVGRRTNGYRVPGRIKAV